MNVDEPGAPGVSNSAGRSGLGGAEAAVMVVFIIVAAALKVSGMPLKEALLLPGGAGLTAVAVTRLATGALAQVLRHVIRAQSASVNR